MINFKSGRWLKQYIAFRQRYPLVLKDKRPLSQIVERESGQQFTSLYHPLYLCLQHSGMLYGFPISYPFIESAPFIKKLSARARAKLILLDTIVFAIYLEEKKPQGEAYRQMVGRVGSCLRNYYRKLSEYGPGEEMEYTEEALFHRIHYKKNHLDFRHNGINSHLFWDLYFFRLYYRRLLQGPVEEAHFFPGLISRKKEMMALSIKVIVAAAYADWQVAREEKRLFRQFRRSARLLSPEQKQQIRHLFQWGLSLDDIQFPELEWIARRFLMDISLLVAFSDSEIGPQEDAFLQQLASRLQLSEQDLLSSKADLGCFIYIYGEELHFYQPRQAGLTLLGQAVYQNLMLLSHAARMEAVETREMAVVFGKILRSRLGIEDKQDLPSEEEIKAALEQLKDIPKFLPFFSLFFMPLPGITEMYILLAISLEKLSKGHISLLPSQLRKVMKRTGQKE